MTNLAGHAARGAATTLVGQSLRFLAQFAGVALLSRLLSPSEFGAYSMVISVVGVAAVLGDFGLSMASIQSQTMTDDQRNNLFWANALIGAVASAAVFFCAPAIAAFYSNPDLVRITQWTSLVFLLNALTPQFRAEATSKLHFAWLSIADVSAQVIGIVVAILMALAGAGYWALVAQQIVIAGVTLVVTAAGASWIPGLPRRGTPMRQLYAFGANTFGVQLITYITGNVDNIVVGRLSGERQLGYYSRAFQLFQLPLQQIASPMTRVALPILSRLNGTDAYESYVRKIQLLLLYTFGGAFFVLIALTSPLIDLLLGTNWAQVKPIFAILAAGGIFQALGYVYYWIFVSTGKTGLQLRFSLVGRSVMVVMIIGGGFFGAVGVAIGVALGQALVWLLYTIFAIPRIGLDAVALVKTGLRPVLAFAGMLLISVAVQLVALRGAGDWATLCIILATIILYFAAVFVIFPGMRRDARFIARSITRIRRS